MTTSHLAGWRRMLAQGRAGLLDLPSWAPPAISAKGRSAARRGGGVHRPDGVPGTGARGLIIAAVRSDESAVFGFGALARRHLGYGVRETHYVSVGAALLWTLEQGLGDEFSAEVRDAWAAAYQMLSSMMMEAAAQPLPQAA